ncbi:fungal-specific transcription factor domain-containing protein [Daldinia bambusicola]|nr:fungal-specific transcription factor domain-containing protein [Daldinia bambusicola]
MSDDDVCYVASSDGFLGPTMAGCNGLKPCSTCDKRSLECLYTPTSLETGSQEPLGSPSKRRHTDNSPRAIKLESGQTITTHTPFLASWDQSTNRLAMSLAEIEPLEPNPKKLMGTSRHLLTSNDREFDTRSRISNVSGAADEFTVMFLPRMLQDKTGRLQYVGESGSLAYLQLIRIIVESVYGPSSFTDDPERHNFVENRIELPSGTRPTGVLPDRKTADILVESFFTNTSGLVEVFHKADFLQQVEECYSDPLNTSSVDLCLLNLVFAIGLVIARPLQGTNEATVIQGLHSEPANRAELFFRNAKTHGPDSGFEDADFWSIQALILMSLYTLSISNRNASHAYHGMAVRSAQALGLHREESMPVFKPHVIRLRRNVWKTLFVLDRILAASLGRPITISLEDCSEYVLDHSIGTTTDEHMMSETTDPEALDAAVNSCYIIGLTLKKIYAERKASTLAAQGIADRLEDWERQLHGNLHCQRLIDASIDSAQAIASLHINLLHCHSVLLLTRPFFLYLLKMGCDDLSRSSKKSPHVSSRLDKFSQACVEASQRTIVLARAALDAEYLPQCNPFVIYFVFSAALIILSNEFASLYRNPDADKSISSALIILQYCKEMDAQAERVLDIIENFHRANMEKQDTAKKIHLPGRKTPTMLHTFQCDTVPPFFHTIKAEQQEFYTNDVAPTKERQIAGLSTSTLEQAMRPMMAPMLQQPSPEGSVSLNSGIATASMAPGMEALGSNDPEFDLDSLWQGWQHPAPTGNMGIPPPLHHMDQFGSYGLHQPPMPHGNGLNSHIQPFPPSNFR